VPLTEADKPTKGGKQGKVSEIGSQNLLNYLSDKSTFNPLINARLANNSEFFGKGLLDSGAFGGHINNYVSQSIVDKLVATQAVVTCDCLNTKVCTILGCIQSNKCIKFNVELYNEIGQTITIDTKARVVKGLPYDFIIGLTTIRKYKLTRVFDSLFSELEGIPELFNEEHPTTYTSTGTDVSNKKTKINDKKEVDSLNITQTSTFMPDASIKRNRLARPFVDYRALETKPEELFLEKISSDRPSAAPMGGNLSRFDYPCKCNTKHTLWCAACSSAEEGDQSAVRDRRTYSQEVINLAECTYTIDNAAHAYLQRLAMPDLVSTLISDHRLNTIFNKEDFLDIEDDSDNIDIFISETPYDKLCSREDSDRTTDSQNAESIKIEGSQEFLSKARLLLEKHANRFKIMLTPEAARLKPFELDLNPGSNWYTSKQNKLPTRLQSKNKRDATREFVKNALDIGLIEPSQAESWSQILLTPKANGKWRFCVDYRFLNKETKSMGWPLPNIKQMLERIGEKKPKYFAVLDLTQGYYQMAISKKARALTAFRTSEGLYQFCRLPMGLKGAPAFFQAAMQQTVLAEMLYSICEVYLDDIIVFAETEEELLANLEKIFSRLEEYNITLNPEKVKIGLRAVEYVGHVIDENGLSFSREKIDDVLATPKPQTHKQMKSFLGLCVQFKDHIDKYSDIVKPLHLMIPNYKTATANQKLVWTPETEACFSDLLNKVNNCPKLFFMNDRAPVLLHTDASKYGIGGKSS
jgi:hypothetical protein